VRRTPRRGRRRERERRRGRRALTVLVVALVVLIPVGIGAWTAVQAVYFVGATEDGFVAVYRGLPYELPAGIELYTTNYVSGVPVEEVPPGRREALLDHTLRSHDDASDLVRELELGRLSER